MPTSQTPLEPTVARNALVILAVIAGGTTLYVLAGILTPLALAMFLAVMIDGFARVLEHRLPHVSRRLLPSARLTLAPILYCGLRWPGPLAFGDYTIQSCGAGFGCCRCAICSRFSCGLQASE